MHFQQHVYLTVLRLLKVVITEVKKDIIVFHFLSAINCAEEMNPTYQSVSKIERWFHIWKTPPSAVTSHWEKPLLPPHTIQTSCALNKNLVYFFHLFYANLFFFTAWCNVLDYFEPSTVHYCVTMAFQVSKVIYSKNMCY